MSKASTRLQAKVTKLYIDMRLKRISKLNWMIESEKVVEALRQIEHADIVPELFYAHLLITKEAYEAVEEVLEEAAEWLRAHSQDAPACHAYYLYLTTLTKDDEAYDGRVAAKLNELVYKYPDIWQIQWLLFYVDRSLATKPLEQYHYLKRMFIRGCRSPLMYLEARVLLERNPTFLYEFSEFEVHLMMFMIRHAGMSNRVSDILADYMLQRTDYRYIYMLILCGCYDVTPSKRILEGICKMMVLGGCVGDKSTLWYRKGISENVKVAGLYEAFMKSLPMDDWYLDGEELTDYRRIPSEVIEYFAHTSGLDDVRTAYLYAMVHKYRDNWFSTYKLYEPLLQPFMMDQLYKGKVNPGLAYLYENLLQVTQLPPERIAGFLDVCHTCKVTGLPVEAGTLQVHYDHYENIIGLPFSGWEAVLPLYGEQFTFTVLNYSGSEISASNVSVLSLVRKELWDDFFAKQEITNVLYQMSKVEASLKIRKPEQEVSSVKTVLCDEKILQSFKEEIAESILPYWDINGAYEEILAAAPFVFSNLGTYSKEKETMFWKKQYMCNHIGIYGMQFLLDHYEGSLIEHGSIFNKAASLGIETGNYAETLLWEMMEAGQLLPQHVEIFNAYCSGDANTELIQAFIEFEAELQHLQERKMASALVQKQAELAVSGTSFSIMAQLAYLHSVVENGVGSMNRELAAAAELFVKALLKQNIYFTWMQPLKGICAELSEKEAFQVLEYRGDVSGPVWVRFSQYTDGKEDADSLQSEVMEMVCEGLYAKSFILFYGERMHYEIFGLEGTEHVLLKQGVLQRGQALEKTNGSRFTKINHMLALRDKRDNWELYQELESYYGQSAMVEQLFVLK